MMKLIGRIALAACLCLGSAEAGRAQRAVLSTDGNELLMPEAKDRECFEAWMARTAADEEKSPGIREVTLDCDPVTLDPNDPDRKPGADIYLSSRTAKCIRDLLKRGIIPPALLSLIERHCGSIRRP
ncbi:MAG: hypothetical protein WBR13_02140 [Allosphingosinicella sp.]